MSDVSIRTLLLEFVDSNGASHIRDQHNCTSDRKRYGKMENVPIRHEYCVIFKKPLVKTFPFSLK